MANGTSIFKRFYRWCRKGVWANLHWECLSQSDLQPVFINITIVRAHACAAGRVCTYQQSKRHLVSCRVGLSPRFTLSRIDRIICRCFFDSKKIAELFRVSVFCHGFDLAARKCQQNLIGYIQVIIYHT